ncbi:MAG: hypothetical protein AAFR54_07835 [Planctomycetota bacterium]
MAAHFYEGDLRAAERDSKRVEGLCTRLASAEAERDELREKHEQLLAELEVRETVVHFIEELDGLTDRYMGAMRPHLAPSAGDEPVGVADQEAQRDASDDAADSIDYAGIDVRLRDVVDRAYGTEDSDARS